MELKNRKLLQGDDTVRGGMMNFAGGGGLFHGFMEILGGVILIIQTFFKAKNNNLQILNID